MTDLSNKLNNRQILTTRSSLSDRLNQSEIKKGDRYSYQRIIKIMLPKIKRSIDFRFSGFSHFRLIFIQSTPMQEFILYV